MQAGRASSFTGSLLPPRVADRPVPPGWAGVARGLGLAAALFGLAILAAWQRGWWEHLTLGPQWVPPAPGTATLLLLLGTALARRGGRDRVGQGAHDRWVTILAGTALVLAVGLMQAALRSTSFDLEAWWLPSPGVRNGIPLGRTAAATAACFGTLALAVVVRERRPDRAGLGLANGLACLVLLVTLLLLQGYLFGGPLLYGTRTIPVAALTALGIHILALAVVATGGVDQWPARLFGADPRIGAGPSRRDLVALLAVVAIFIATSGAFWARTEQARASARAAEIVASVADLRADEITRWFEGYASTARTAAVFPVVVPNPREWIGSADGQAWLREIREASRFASVTVLTAAGQVVATSDPGGKQSLPVPPADGVADSVMLHDVHRREGQLRLGFWVPLRQVARLDPLWLYLAVDLADAWATLLVPPDGGTRAIDLTLWEARGGQGRVLNDVVRAGDHLPALSRATTFDPDVEVVPGIPRGSAEGEVREGTDVHGRAVAAVVRPIPGTDWLLSASTPLEASRTPIVRLALRATALSLVAFLAVGALLAAIWSRRDLAVASRELHLVHEREQSVEELRRSEDRYARAMRGTSDGLWDWDLRDDSVYLSPHWREMLGIATTVPRNVQEAFYDRLHPDDAAAAQTALAAHLDHGAPFSIELRLRRDDGVYRWFWDRGEVERDAEGRAVRMAGAITDISARREAEARLQETERLLRMRSAINLALVRARSEDELYRLVCEVAVREGGYRMAWVARAERDARQRITVAAAAGVGVDYLDGIELTWADRDWGRGATGRAIRCGRAAAVQDLAADPGFTPWREVASARGFAATMAIPLEVDGTVLGAFVLYASQPHAFDHGEQALLTDIGGDIVFGIGALRDHVAVDRQRNELALFREAFERSNDAIFITDAATGRFIDFNAAASRWLQYTPEELRQLGPPDVVVQLGFLQRWADVADAVKASGSVIWPRTFRRKDGSDIPAEVGLTAITSGGRDLILSIARDISERDELLARLARSERMESVGRLAGGVAHDFNNLLTVINTTADLAQRELPPASPVQEDLTAIRAAGSRAAELTRQLLAFSRQQVLRRDVVALNDLITGFTGMLRRVIGENITIATELDPGLPAVYADRGQIEQVLMNLAVNARDAMPDGGALTIRTESTVITQEALHRMEGVAPGTYAVLTVRDTGVGMDRKTQAMIFEPFFTTKPAGQGTGLGLATVYGVVKQSGGGIWVDSEPGHGTTFRILLPATVATPREPEDAAPDRPKRGTETILVVEDEAAIRQVVSRVLTGLGYTVLEAPGGVEALQLLDRTAQPIDLVLTDIIMPGMTGTMLAAILRELNPALRILFTSGYSTDAIRGSELLGEDAHFISKPYTVPELAQEIRRVLDT
ncbi:MAG TPA: PAS domain S-box protein [Gemmatimonadales bacterium]|nr:PAS domain S-box protein [Gemmatimonadales bacterium]